jgi:predicted TIM-barrel fold metal-dependent hydrolase
MPVGGAVFFFDCNVSFGAPPKPGLREAVRAEELLEEMNHCGVDEALVTCALQRTGSPLVGNPLVVAETRSHPRLHPAWAILPSQTGEFATVPSLVAQLRDTGVRALWTWPSMHNYLLDTNTFGPLLEEMVARRLPLFLPQTESSGSLSGWSLVSALLSDFPRLTVVATGQSVWGQDRYFRPLVDRYPNLYLETSHYELAHGLRAFYERYGAERMLFGSAFPKRYMGGAVFQLAQADLPDAAIQAIAGGNLRRMLSEVVL